MTMWGPTTAVSPDKCWINVGLGSSLVIVSLKCKPCQVHSILTFIVFTLNLFIEISIK